MKGLTKCKILTQLTRPDQLIVSFCIPVYNNAEAAEKIVKGILCSDSTRIEVIVSDDTSADDAEERLSRIHDSRFRYYRNEKNLGAHKNWEHALELGHGEYLYLVMGRDKINGESINRLIEILEYAHENNITLIKDGYSKKDEIQIYEGIDAMIFFISITHPTGTIFNRRLFESIPDRTKYFEISDMYPENYIRHYLLLYGKGASVMSGVYFYPSPLINKVKIKSTVEHDKDIYEMFYAPKRRTAQIHELIDLIESDSSERFSDSEKDKFFRIKFRNILRAVSTEWKRFCMEQDWQAHYGQQVRHVSIPEMIRNIFTAYYDTVRHLRKKGFYTHTKRRIMNHLTLKLAAKLIFEPLGIWRVLSKIKRFIKG